MESNDVGTILTDDVFRTSMAEPCAEVTSVEEGQEIAAKLFRTLNTSKTGIGLSANQIGINKRVCVVNVKEPLFLINPKIVESDGEVIYLEGCLSFPNESVRTKRYSSIVVEAENYEGQLYWDVTDIVNTNDYMSNNDVLECIAVQHEISHLDGKTMFDDEYKPTPTKSKKSIGRNDIVNISNDTETLEVKYKKFLSKYEKEGYKLSND